MTIVGLATDNTAVIRNSSSPSDECDADSGECHEYLPGEQDVLWDPQRANEAEQRGEDIDGFLRGDYELVKKEYLMELLHKCNYNVGLARSEYKRVLQFPGEPSSALGKDEGREFENLLKSSNRMKNFDELSKEIRRSRADCMIHYYRWKRTTSEEYLPMKMEWKKKAKKKEDEEDHPFAEEDSLISPSSTWVRRSIRPRRFPTPPPIAETGMATTNSTDTHTDNDGSSAGTTKDNPESSELKQTQMQIQETKEQKEKLLKVGDIVYAKYHQNREYYWGRITSSTMIPSKGLRYHVQFHDGDESPSVSATNINRGSKMVESIRNGWWDEYLPPQEYLEELYKETDNDQRKQNAVDCGGGDDDGDTGAVVGKENATTTSNHVSSQTKRAASQDNIEDKSGNLQNPNQKRRRSDANTKQVDKKPFPELLFNLLERADADPAWAQIIGWVENGTAFEIFDGGDFVTIVMPTEFTTCRMKNFCHQLRWYGFDRIGDGKYRHIQFNRKNKDQSIRIPRLKGSPKPFAPGFTNINMKPEKRKADHAGFNKKLGQEKGGGEANESAICRPKRRRTSVSAQDELTTVNADKPGVAAAAATSNISHKKKPTPLTNQKLPGCNDVSAVTVVHESNCAQEKGDREGQKDCPITLSDDDDDDLAAAFTEPAAVGIHKEGVHSSPKDKGLPIVVDDAKQLPQLQKASSQPGQASPNVELDRLRNEGRKAALYYIQEKDKRKQLLQEHEALMEKERNAQQQLLVQQETVKSAVRDLERLRTESSFTVHGLEEKLRQTVLMYQTREEKTKEFIRQLQAHSSATSAKLAAAEGQLLEERAKGAAQAVELAKTENNLNQVHDSWQEQYTQLEDKNAQIEQMKLQLESQQAEIGRERALREDSEQRYHNVTRSLALQTSELARERQERRRLEQLVASLVNRSDESS